MGFSLMQPRRPEVVTFAVDINGNNIVFSAGEWCTGAKPPLEDEAFYTPSAYLEIMRASYRARKRYPAFSRSELTAAGVPDGDVVPAGLLGLLARSVSEQARPQAYAEILKQSWMGHVQAICALGRAAVATKHYAGRKRHLPPLTDLDKAVSEPIIRELSGQWRQLVELTHAVELQIPPFEKPYYSGLFGYDIKELHQVLKAWPQDTRKIVDAFLKYPKIFRQWLNKVNLPTPVKCAQPQGDPLFEFILNYPYPPDEVLEDFLKNRKPGQIWPMKDLKQMRRMLLMLENETRQLIGISDRDDVYRTGQITFEWLERLLRPEGFKGELRNYRLIPLDTLQNDAEEADGRSSIEIASVAVRATMFDRVLGEIGSCGADLGFMQMVIKGTRRQSVVPRIRSVNVGNAAAASLAQKSESLSGITPEGWREYWKAQGFDDDKIRGAYGDLA